MPPRKSGGVAPLPPTRKRKASRTETHAADVDESDNYTGSMATEQGPNRRRRTQLNTFEESDNYIQSMASQDQGRNIRRRTQSNNFSPEEEEDDEAEDSDVYEEGSDANEEAEDEDADADGEADDDEEEEKSRRGKSRKKYAVTTRTNPNGRRVGRNLVNWSSPRDLQLLLIIFHELHAAGLDASELMTKVIKRLENDPNKTGAAVFQHVDKLRQRAFESGAMVPPYNGRDNCPVVSEQFRGVIKAPKTKANPRGWRDVTWDEDLVEHIDPDFNFDTSVPIGKKTAINPGKKPEQRLENDQKGFTDDHPIIRRKAKSSAEVVRNRNGDSLPFVPPGYSTRPQRATSYTKKRSSAKAPSTASKPKSAASQKKRPQKQRPQKQRPQKKRRGDYDSDDEDAQNVKLEEEDDGEEVDDEGEGEQDYSPAQPSYQGGGKILAGTLVRNHEVRPQLSSEPERESDDGEYDEGGYGDQEEIDDSRDEFDDVGAYDRDEEPDEEHDEMRGPMNSTVRRASFNSAGQGAHSNYGIQGGSFPSASENSNSNHGIQRRPFPPAGQSFYPNDYAPQHGFRGMPSGVRDNMMAGPRMFSGTPGYLSAASPAQPSPHQGFQSNGAFHGTGNQNSGVPVTFPNPASADYPPPPMFSGNQYQAGPNNNYLRFQGLGRGQMGSIQHPMVSNLSPMGPGAPINMGPSGLGSPANTGLSGHGSPAGMGFSGLGVTPQSQLGAHLSDVQLGPSVTSGETDDFLGQSGTSAMDQNEDHVNAANELDIEDLDDDAYIAALVTGPHAHIFENLDGDLPDEAPEGGNPS